MDSDRRPRSPPHVEIGACHREAGRDRRRAAVNRVNAVGVHVVREAGRAADPRDEHVFSRRTPSSGSKQLHRGQDAVVPATRAPADFLSLAQSFREVTGTATSVMVQPPWWFAHRRRTTTRVLDLLKDRLLYLSDPKRSSSTFDSTSRPRESRSARAGEVAEVASGTRIAS